MKDFAEFDGQDAFAGFQRKQKDSMQMAQHGYKKFQRKSGRREAVLERYNQEQLLQVEVNDAQLPTTLPEPWEQMRRVSLGARTHLEARSPLVNAFRDDPAAKAFDLLRTRLLQTLKSRGWKRVAVCAPFSGCGTTFTAVNLALSMARVPGSRTILMDMNLRNPGVSDALKMSANGDMAGYLQGAEAMEEFLIKPAESLAVGLARGSSNLAAETLQDPLCEEVLDDMIEASGADAVIYDLPPVLEYDDLAAFLPQVDGVLLVSDGTSTTAAHLEACEKLLAGHCELLGVVLNRARSNASVFGG
jgi:Mrp family chromosome partitioning ATPase